MITAAEQLAAGSRVTIFAPTDAAFAAAEEAFGGELPQDEEIIAQVPCRPCMALATLARSRTWPRQPAL